ncbi:type II secretion system protein, partial [bacterium]|nr:type II secretion system protein [bacterium]
SNCTSDAITTQTSFARNDRRRAFTLAEVLITLAIIGVVAAMTIPTLISKYEEKQVVTSLRKFQTTFTQAYLKSTVDHGFAREWDVSNNSYDTGFEYCTRMFDKFKPYLKLAKDCGNSQGCFASKYTKVDGKETYLDYDADTSYYRVILADGMSVLFYSRGTSFSKLGNTTEHGTFIVDINGTKGPNMIGKDTFTFFLTNNGVLPVGDPSYGYAFKIKDSDGNFVRDENGDYVMSTDPIDDCNRTQCVGDCEGCAAWVIKVGNMDYLHCDGLSWSGKRQCSD